MLSLFKAVSASPLQSLARNYATKTIFVGNLSNFTSPEVIEETFSQYGTVTNVRRPNARFGFVEMEEAEAEEAVKNLNGFVHSEREWNVKIARDSPKKGGYSWSEQKE
ncbi:hypothetical protein K493DRAFT_312509, partial [Basidiobolus meristosporus CBS 931.73]